MADRDGMKKVMQAFADGVKDLTSLEVHSFSGELAFALTDDGSAFDWDKLLSKAKSGKLQLVLATKFDLDGDASLFRTSGPIPEGLETAHADAVRAGQQVRTDIANFFKGLISDLI